MAALTQARMGIRDTLDVVSLPLAASNVAFVDGMACADITTGTVKRGVAGNANLLRIGEFQQNVDNSAGTGTVQVMVRLEKEVFATWFDNATGGNAVLAANLFSDVWMLDDHTVTLASGGNSKAGRVWGVDAVKGVLVESYTL